MHIQVAPMMRPGEVRAAVYITFHDMQPGVIFESEGGCDLAVLEVLVIDDDTETVVLKVWNLNDNAEPFQARLEHGGFHDGVVFRGVLGRYFKYIDPANRPEEKGVSLYGAWTALCSAVLGSCI